MTATGTRDALVDDLCGDLSAIRAPRGTELLARSWSTEAPLRMLLNNLDPEVAERPEELVVYGGSGKAARSPEALRAIVRTLLTLGEDETLLVQSGKPVGVFRTHAGAPRVLIANSLLVPRWAAWDECRRLEALGLTMFGQMTAGSWIYIGSQGILQGTYQTFGAAGEKHFGSADLRGRTILTAGLGGMGGAQPLAGTMAGAAILCVEVDPQRIERRLETRYLDEAADSLEDALARLRAAAAERRPLSVGLVGNAADVVPELVARGEEFDLITDQTAAHDPLNGYVPRGSSVDGATALRASDPDEYLRLARESIVRHVEALLEYVRRGAYVFDYGNNLRGEAREGGVEDAFAYPGFVPAYIRPLFCRGVGPFRWAVLSGDPADIATIDERLRELFPDDPLLQRWLDLAPERVAFQGLPARICWLGYGDRAKAGLAINELVHTGAVSAPVVIGRDHLDSGSVASPYRETEAMRDGSDAIADWPILNALLNVAAGATWVSVHHGGGVGIGNSIHAGMVVVADGSDEMAERLERVLTTDPGTGVLRHVDAGYSDAIAFAGDHGRDAGGGGMLATVGATRSAGEGGLAEVVRRHRGWMRRAGTTTFEAKSGYGLDRETELASLRAIREAGGIATWLGAHAVPPEFSSAAAYLEFALAEVLPQAARLAVAADVFVEEGAFDVDEARRYLEACRAAGLALRLHGDQFTERGAIPLAVELGARSVDHLEATSDAGVGMLAASEVVGVLLPVSAVFLDRPMPPARALVDAGAAIALATDFNPGSSFCESLGVVSSLAVTQLHLSPAEALAACTVNAAHVVGLGARVGRIAPGYTADLVVLDAADWRYLSYHLGADLVAAVVEAGEITWQRAAGRSEPKRPALG